LLQNIKIYIKIYDKLPDDGLVKPKHVGAFIVYFNVNFNILKQMNCALGGLI